MTAATGILLVDDDEVDIETVRRAFAERGLDNPITIANDGLEALAILRGENGHEPMPKPCIILLDINMPRMSGIEFLEELRRDPATADAVVFVLSTSDSPQDREVAYRYRVAGYMIKSEIGHDFVEVAGLIQCFERTMLLPPARQGSPARS